VKTELIIRSNSSDIDFALLKDGRLTALNNENNGNKFSVGDIYLAKIGKVLTGLNASFVNVGYAKDGFLHYHDLGAQMRSLSKFIKGVSTGRIRDYTLKNFKLEKELDKHGSIVDVLQPGQNMLVQIVKEPISTKGPRMSSEISIAGRYLVLVPFSDRVSVSQKIKEASERDRLRRLVKSIKPKGFGVIIRTVAENKKVAQLDRDLQNSVERWIAMCKKVRKVRAHQMPTKVLSELNRASSILRDLFNDSFTSIVTNDETLFLEIKEYLQEIAPDKEKIVRLYRSKVPIFEKFVIERQIKTSFGRTVSMSKGAYLVIEHTEALHVIDVNSGNRSNKATSQADTALEVNMIAATEIARQLQLRDMGGIIVIDFIDMHTAEHRRKLYEHLKYEMSFDRTKHKILPPSKFGLVQITRQRVRPELVIKTQEPDPSKDASEVEAPIVMLDKFKVELDRLFAQDKHRGITLNVHPFVAAFLKKGFPSVQQKWFTKYKKWIKIIPRDAFQYLQYEFTDSTGDRID
jgi:ribonuclease G